MLGEDGRSRIETLIRLSRRESSLIESLLQYSRMGQTQLSYDEVDLDGVVNQVIDTVKSSFPNENINIAISRRLPSVWCDAVRVEKVFSNLVANAVKYNDKPTKSIKIGYEAASSNEEDALGKEASTISQDRYVFYVEDNGIGIKDKDREYVFAIFKRLQEGEKLSDGTGAGLAIAKRIVERHGGEIWVTSQQGEGSIFYFTLGQEKEP